MTQTRGGSSWVNVSCSRTQHSDNGEAQTNPVAPRSQVDGWMDAWMDAWIDGWMDACMDACMDPSIRTYIHT